MFYHHLAHLDLFDRHVKSGVKIMRGDPIGKVGKTGTQYSHVHYEVLRTRPESWTQYVYGKTGPLTRDQIFARYADPSKWIDKAARIPAPFTTYGGYGFLDPINGTGTAFHPGIDINDGYGDQDLGNNIRSPCKGEIAYVGRLDGGWGNHIWILEDEGTEHPAIDMAFAKNVAGRMFLAVEERGEAWYVDPTGVRHYMGGTQEEMLSFVRRTATGISNADLNKIPKLN